MKKLSIFVLVLMFGLFLTGCGNKEEDKENTNTNKPYREKLDSGATMTLYDNDGNIIDESGFINNVGYVIGKGKDLVSVSYEKDGNNLVVTGKKSGDAEVTIYYFDDNKECLSETTLKLTVDDNLNVTSSGLSGGFGTCTQNIDDVTILK